VSDGERREHAVGIELEEEERKLILLSFRIWHMKNVHEAAGATVG
jgi:hypothetical protein